MSNGDLMGQGEMMGEDDLVGAIRAVLARGRGGGALARRVYSKPPLAPTEIRPDSKLRSYMGVGSVSYGAAEIGLKTATVEPQESFRGERLVIEPFATGGVDAGLATMTLQQITVGTQPQSPSVEFGAPIAMFRADATYAGLDLQIAYRGTKLAVSINRTTAPGAGVTAGVNIGLYGEWIR